jgi:putative endonuclease
VSKSRQAFGRWGEALAAEYLVERGYTILERNARTPYGEIDLVAQQVEEISPGEAAAGSHPGGYSTIFVEVKTRSSRSFGLPEEAVTSRKQAHMLAAAQAYLQQHPELEGNWRIDVIAIQRYEPSRPPTIHHFENAIS